MKKLCNTLFIDDNLSVMARIPDNTIDLIATDPPFNSAQFRASKTTKYPDVWRQGKVFTDQLETKLSKSRILDKKKDKLIALLDLLGDKDKPNSDRTFIAFMTLRAIEMHRILKDTGSLYWQCDPTMSHALKLMLDIIFGKSNFRNEVVWIYGKMNNASKNYPQNHDTILFYSKSNQYCFNAIKKEDSEYKNRWGQFIVNNKITYGAVKHKTDKMLNLRIKKIKKHLGKSKLADNDILFDFDTEFKPLDNNWYISIIKGNSAERTGYPTQKPLALFERIVRASSNKGDLVLDPFCGCATTPIATLRVGEGRCFIGIDVNGTAIKVITDRLSQEVQAGTLDSGYQDSIRYIVNKDLINDSVTDINNILIHAKDILDKALVNKPELNAQTDARGKKVLKKIQDVREDIGKLEIDRAFLQDRLMQTYPALTDYLDPIDTSYIEDEPELTSAEKKSWKIEQIKLNTVEKGKYNCPGYFYRGQQVKCLTLTEDGVYPTANTQTIEIDRIIPGAMGGKYTKSNMQAICNKCNSAKRDRA